VVKASCERGLIAIGIEIGIEIESDGETDFDQFSTMVLTPALISPNL